jgi:CheY-like chemotaxis protein
MESESIDLHNKNILIVDDETDLREIMAEELEFMGARVTQAENILNAQDLLQKHPVDLIISDIRMPGGSGVELLEIVKNKFGPDLPVILITGFADITPMDAYGKGAVGLISKPFHLDDLFKMVVKHLFMKTRPWHEVIDTTKKVQPLGDKIVVGRGGASFYVKLRERIDLGEGLRFDFQIEGKHLSGTGICRWIKAQGPESAILGLEFSSLDDDVLKQLPLLRRSDSYIPTATEF